jgi:hypothetical protein
VYRRSAIERVGGFDEAFLRAQDWEMNHRIRSAGGIIWFQPRMRVSYRPRASLRALGRQYFHYGRWRRVVSRQHRGTINLRYLAPPLVVLAVGCGLAVGLSGIGAAAAGFSAAGWLALALVLPAGYLCGVLGAALVIGRGLPARAAASLAAVLVTMHLCWGTGFLTSPRGLIARSSHRIAPEIREVRLSSSRRRG